jgi:hypothetical protein
MQPAAVDHIGLLFPGFWMAAYNRLKMDSFLLLLILDGWYMSQALLIHDCNTLSTLNYVIKGCVHRLMQRPGLSSHFEEKKSRGLDKLYLAVDLNKQRYWRCSTINQRTTSPNDTQTAKIQMRPIDLATSTLTGPSPMSDQTLTR